MADRGNSGVWGGVFGMELRGEKGGIRGLGGVVVGLASLGWGRGGLAR
jgi:hypothetical protein